MKPILTLPLLCIAAFTAATLTTTAAEPSINELLRDALYLEEVNRDAEAAAKQYAEVISRYEAERNHAGTALFRLAEIRRKQGRKDEAIALYQKLITEFPKAGTEIGLAREHLATLGGKAPAGTQEPAPDIETKLIAEYEQLRKTSPDVADRPIYLSLAVTNNHLRVTKYLLEKGTDPNSRIQRGGSNGAHTALSLAASQGSLAVCEMLLDAGAKTETPGSLNPLSQAVFKGYPKIVELLLKRGAKPNVDSESADKDEYEGTPLAIAARYGHERIMDQLLLAGADPNLAMPSNAGLTPLHFSILYENEPLARKLIAAGARTDLPAKEQRQRTSERVINVGATPLMVCAAYGSRELMEFMASKATKEELSPLLPYVMGSPEKFSWLLKQGADPNTRTAQGFPLLLLAFDKPEILRGLLAAGADPNATYFSSEKSLSKSDQSTPLHTAARSYRNLIPLLVDAGAKPDEAWMKRLLAGEEQWFPADQFLFERFMLPVLGEHKAITLITSYRHVHKPIEIATEEIASPPEDLAKLLTQPKTPIQWIKTRSNGIESWADNVTVWRKTEGAAKAIWKGKITGAEAFPKLQWGDVIQLSIDAPKQDPIVQAPVPGSSDSSSVSFEVADKLPPAFQWALRKRISFPIQVEMDGKTTAYQMRGDRLAFDPTQPELPLMDSAMLAWLLCPGSDEVNISIIRKNSPEIRTSTSYQSGKASFRAHDLVKLSRANEPSADKRKGRIEVRATGLPISQTYTSKETLSPTLVQILADVLSYRDILPEKQLPDASQVVEQLMGLNSYTFSLWINPDLSNIRIRRLGENDEETTMVINLTEIIEAHFANTSSVDPVKADIPLRGGDIVEITLKGDPDHSWSGLSAKETEFFRKVLNCSIQNTDRKLNVSMHQLTYHPLTYVDTEAGKLPVLSGDPDLVLSTMTPNAAFGYSKPTVTRDGVPYRAAGTRIFLKDGDQISADENAPSAPRPRIVVPPGANR